MQRRGFLKQAGAAAALGSMAVPALAQGKQKVTWRMSTSWPKSLDTVYVSAEEMCKRVGEITEGGFEIKCFSGGELVPPMQNMDAVSNGTVECNHVLASFYIGKNPAIAFDTGLPFGLSSRQHNAWMQYGGGMAAMRKLYEKYGIVNFVCGNVGVQMGGWYRKEIKSLNDLKGLKMRIAGLGGIVMSKLGVVPQQIPTADIFPSLEKGTIDAAEWIGPYDDEKLGLHRVAKNYYTPGWWEGSASITTMVNAKAYEALPAAYKTAFEMAANEQTMKMLAKYDARNPDAMKKLQSQGVKVRYFPKDVMEASFKATMETFQELAEKNPDFKAIFPQWKAFQKDQADWFSVADHLLDSYTFAALNKKSK